MEHFQALLWVDIVQGKLFIYDPETDTNDMVKNYDTHIDQHLTRNDTHIDQHLTRNDTYIDQHLTRNDTYIDQHLTGRSTCDKPSERWSPVQVIPTTLSLLFSVSGRHRCHAANGDDKNSFDDSLCSCQLDVRAFAPTMNDSVDNCGFQVVSPSSMSRKKPCTSSSATRRLVRGHYCSNPEVSA